MKTGTGRILGRVLASDSGTPIRRAQVRLTAPEIGVKTALTDAEGRFEFRELPGGRFSLNASKSGYVNVQYGQTRPFEQGRPIELADKQVLDKADISMPRGGVISGRLTDEFGDPVPDAMVSAMRQTWSNGRRRLTADRPHRSDQRSRPVPDVRTAAGRVLRQRDAAQHRHHDARRRDARRRRVRCVRLDAVVRLRADVLSRNDGRGQRAARHGGHRARKRRTPTSRWHRCAWRGSAAR